MRLVALCSAAQTIFYRNDVVRRYRRRRRHVSRCVFFFARINSARDEDFFVALKVNGFLFDPVGDRIVPSIIFPPFAGRLHGLDHGRKEFFTVAVRKLHIIASQRGVQVHMPVET